VAILTVLITNDDGIDAAGLHALEDVLAPREDVELWVAAPDAPRSACGHGMTLAKPISVRQVGERRFAVGGLPADCVYAAMFGLMPRRPDVVISGVNRGPNLGTDVVYSGTVAGARETVIRRVLGVAVSLVRGENYAPAASNAVEIALALARLDGPARLLNLNYPGGAFTGPVLARLGERRYPEQTERHVDAETNGVSLSLGGPPVEDGLLPGSDGWLISRGVASATFLAIDQTDDGATASSPLGLITQDDFFSKQSPC
jgi:5'-nucleotidase